MLRELSTYQILSDEELERTYGNGAITLTFVTCFAIIAIVTVLIYKIYGAKTGDITLPGGFKFKFTT